MFKWKPLEQNSIDFCYVDGNLYCRTSQREHYAEDDPRVLARGGRPTLGCMARMEEQNIPMWATNDTVVECAPKCITRDGTIVWRMVKERRDKVYPNVDWVAKNVIRSIMDNVTQDDLVRLCLREPLKELPPPMEPHLKRESMSESSGDHSGEGAWTFTVKRGRA